MRIKNFVLGALAAGLIALSPAIALSQSCTGTTCDLGGVMRLQLGQGLPLPISFATPPTGLILSAMGGIPAISGATIMQTTGPAPRALTLPPAQLNYDGPTLGVPVVGLNPAVLSVRTNLSFEFPAASGLTPNRPTGSVMFSAGGRAGAAVVSHCLAPGLAFGSVPAPATFNPGCLGPNTTSLAGAPLAHGFARYTATRNQFGGNAIARTGGTAEVFFNVASLTSMQLPCTGGPACLVGIQFGTPPATQAGGASFLTPPNLTPANNNPTGILSASIGPAGTVLALGDPQTDGGGNNLPFPGQDATSWGLPWTTGRLTQSNTVVPPGAATSMFVRTGVDDRNANGSGLVSMVGGTMSARELSGTNANRVWVTLRVPEVGALAGSGMALLAIGAFHALTSRRRESRQSE